MEMERIKKRRKIEEENGGGKQDEEAEILGARMERFFMLKLQVGSLEKLYDWRISLEF